MSLVPPLEGRSKLPPKPKRSSKFSNALPRAFSLTIISGQDHSTQDKVQKLLFEDSDASLPPSPLPIFYQNYCKHRRLSSTIVKSVDQSYEFCRALQSAESVSDISVFSMKEEKSSVSPIPLSKRSAKHSSIFASTAAARSSSWASAYELSSEYPKEEHFSTIYTLSSDTPSKKTTHKSNETDSDAVDPYLRRQIIENSPERSGISLRFNEDIFEVELFRQEEETFKYEQKALSASLGLLPTRTYCFKCNTEVVTDVALRMPKVSRLRRMCCISAISDCDDASEMKNSQEFQHFCVYCRTLLGTVTGSFA